eukprot:scaffold285_cov330-Pavlova_lutheri.AAC.84
MRHVEREDSRTLRFVPDRATDDGHVPQPYSFAVLPGRPIGGCCFRFPTPTRSFGSSIRSKSRFGSLSPTESYEIDLFFVDEAELPLSSWLALFGHGSPHAAVLQVEVQVFLCTCSIPVLRRIVARRHGRGGGAPRPVGSGCGDGVEWPQGPPSPRLCSSPPLSSRSFSRLIEIFNEGSRSRKEGGERRRRLPPPDPGGNIPFLFRGRCA